MSYDLIYRESDRIMAIADGQVRPPANYGNVAFAFVLAIYTRPRRSVTFSPSKPDEWDGKRKIYVERLAPAAMTGNMVFPKLFAHNLEYILGAMLPDQGGSDNFSDVDSIRKRYESHLTLARECFRRTQEPLVNIAVQALEDIESGALNVSVPSFATRSQLVTVMVDGTYLVDLPSVRSFWAEWCEEQRLSQDNRKKRGKSKLNGTSREAMAPECMVTGVRTIPMRVNLTPVRGLLDESGQVARLNTFNNRSLCSYGWRQNENAPMSPQVGEDVHKALSVIMTSEQMHFTDFKHNRTSIFWSKSGAALLDPVDRRQDQRPAEFHAALLSKTPVDPNSPADNVWAVKNALLAPEPNQKPGAVPNADWTNLSGDGYFYLMISASSRHVIIREVHEGTLPERLENLRLYFKRLNLVRYSGEADPEGIGPTVNDLCASIVRPSLKPSQVDAALADALRRLANFGVPVPRSIENYAHARLDALVWTPIFASKGSSNTPVSLPRLRVALMKLLLTQRAPEEIADMLTSETTEALPQQVEIAGRFVSTGISEAESSAYHRGRLFATYELLQRRVTPEVTGTIRSTMWKPAQTRPAEAFQRLDTLANAHLDRIDRKMRGNRSQSGQESKKPSIFHLNRISDIRRLTGIAPVRTTPRERDAFALGYSHHMVADAQRLQAYRSGKRNDLPDGIAGNEASDAVDTLEMLTDEE